MVVIERGGPPPKMPNTILVVDDEKNIVQLARLYLGNEGFRVEEAHEGVALLVDAAADDLAVGEEQARVPKPGVVRRFGPTMDSRICRRVRRWPAPKRLGPTRWSASCHQAWQRVQERSTRWKTVLPLSRSPPKRESR